MKSLACALLLALASCGVNATQSGPGWPGEAWPVSTPEAEGVNAAAIDSLIADIDAGRYGYIDSFLLIRNGRVIADRSWDRSDDYARILAEADDTALHQYNYDHPTWHPFYRGTRLHSLQSVTKSVMSIAFGIAVDEGRIPGPDAPVWPYFEDYGVDLSDSLRAETTIEDFLTMRSGIEWARPGQGYADGSHPTIEMEMSDRWIEYVLSKPVTTEPGTDFDYNDGVSVLLGKIVRETTGQRLDHWTDERLFTPIGIDEFYWKETPTGETDSEGGLYLTTHDLARVAYLMLRGGEWDGRRIVSREWVEASTAPAIPDLVPNNDRPDTGYGYQWWVPYSATKIFAGNGYGGQFVHIVPEYDLISVFNGWTIRDATEMSSWTALQERILPAVR
ncbi:MAG: serine hydrolase [Gemmatimonadetes bacterium]|nr:serine hydrolase [Gemmatimonadota bacterium]